MGTRTPCLPVLMAVRVMQVPTLSVLTCGRFGCCRPFPPLMGSVYACVYRPLSCALRTVLSTLASDRSGKSLPPWWGHARWLGVVCRLPPAPVRMLRLYFPGCLAPRRSVPLRVIAGGSVVGCPILVDAGRLACALRSSVRAERRGEGQLSREGGANAVGWRCETVPEGHTRGRSVNDPAL